MELQFELVDADDRLEPLREAWTALTASQQAPSHTLGLSWIEVWRRVYGPEVELAIGLFRRGGRLVGVAPMCVRERRYGSFLRFRSLEFLGGGYLPDDAWSTHLNLLAAPGEEAAVAEAFGERLGRGDFGRWDECRLDMLDSGEPVCAALRGALQDRRSWRLTASSEQTCFADLPDSWEAYLAVLGKKKRQQIRKRLKTFEEWLGDREERVVRATDRAGAATGFDILKRLHEERWAAVGKQGAFANPQFCDFHEGLIDSLFDSGGVNLSWLCVDGEPVAVNYGFVAGGVLYDYQGGRAMGIPPEVRVGEVLVARDIQHAIAQGVRRYDFTVGDQMYKRRYCTEKKDLISVRVARPIMKEHARSAAKWSRRRVKEGLRLAHAAALAVRNPGAVK